MSTSSMFPSLPSQATVVNDPNGWHVDVALATDHAVLSVHGFATHQRPLMFEQRIPRADGEAMIALTHGFDLAGMKLAPAPQEHERKFLVINDAWRAQADAGSELRQLYLAKDPNRWQARLRLDEQGHAKITIKGPRIGISNPEFEYAFDEDAALQIWSCSPGDRLMKRRHKLPSADGVWEIDVFISPALTPLIMAEIELPTPTTPFAKPVWVGADVSEDSAYRNDTLAARVAASMGQVTTAPTVRRPKVR